MEKSNINTVKIVRWAARFLGTSLTALVILFVLREGVNIAALTLKEVFLFIAFSPIVIGLITGWKKEKIGGLITVFGFIIFYFIEMNNQNSFRPRWLFFLFPLVGLMYLYCAFVEEQKKKVGG